VKSQPTPGLEALFFSTGGSYEYATHFRNGAACGGSHPADYGDERVPFSSRPDQQYLTGKFTHETAWYIFGGGAAGLLGLLMLLFGTRGSNA
jgi:hypothetical protein